jgi:hypothetical protein
MVRRRNPSPGETTALWIGAIAVGGYLIYSNWASIVAAFPSLASLFPASTATTTTAALTAGQIAVMTAAAGDQTFWPQVTAALTTFGYSSASAASLIAQMQAMLNGQQVFGSVSTSDLGTTGQLEQAIMAYVQSLPSQGSSTAATSQTVATPTGPTSGWGSESNLRSTSSTPPAAGCPTGYSWQALPMPELIVPGQTPPAQQYGCELTNPSEVSGIGWIGSLNRVPLGMIHGGAYGG